MSKFEMQTPPNMLEFRHTNVANEWVMCITADKRIEVNEDVEVTEAAKKLLETMQHMLTPQRTWVGLTEEDFVCVHQLCDTPIQAAEYVNHLLKEKNNA